MAGTAAGAAKATAARLARRAAAQSNVQPSSDDASDVGDVDASLPVVAAVPGPVAAVPTVPTTGQAVTALLPGAARHVERVIAGKTKASPAVRTNAALEVLKMATRPAPAAGGSSAPEALAGVLGALARALGARVPRTVEGAAVEIPPDDSPAA